LLLGVLVVVAPACGKRGPPLPPLRPAPDKITDVSVVRRDGEISVRFNTAIKNADGSQPVLFDRVEIYALTVPAGSPSPDPIKIVLPKNRIAVLGKRPLVPPTAVKAPPTGAEPEPPVAMTLSFVDKVATVVPPPPTPVPALPAPGRGGAAGAAGAATGAAFVAGAAGTAGAAGVDAQGAPAVAIATIPVTTRFYMAVPFANNTRRGTWSDLIVVPLSPVPVAPKNAAIKYDEQTVTVSWVSGVTPIPVGQTYQVYDANPGVDPNARPLNPAPLTAAEFKRPVVFGARVCFAIRTARVTAPVAIESAPTDVVCETLADTFPPPAPSGLLAFAAEGSITLTWDGVTATDLAGYIVLRGEGTGETLQPLMTTPVAVTTFTDSTTKAGVRYVYAVVAVDSATPANRSKQSNRAEETTGR
jgi:hypothetical protein